jgi:glycosyltransferase involved in cell wall biosynthesis
LEQHPELSHRTIFEVFDPRIVKAGGIDTCIRGLVKFAPPGLDLSIVGADAFGDLELGTWHDVTIGGRTIPFMPVIRPKSGIAALRIPPALLMMTGLTRWRPEVPPGPVQAHRLSIGRYLRLRYKGHPVVQFYHNDGVQNLLSGSESHFRRAPALLRMLEASQARGADDVVVFSESGARRLQSISRRVRFSPTWFDDESFTCKSEVQPSDTEGPIRVLWIGRLDPSKDPDLAIDALEASAGSFTVYFVGDGRLAAHVEERLQRVAGGGRRRAVPKEVVPGLMRDHDLVLMTSHYEGFPRTIIESLACGTPVVTTSGGDPSSIVVTGVNGHRVSSRDPMEIVKAIRKTARTIPPGRCADTVRHLSASQVVPSVLGCDAGGIEAS